MEVSRIMNKISIFIISVILLFIVVIIGINHSAIVSTSMISVLAALLAFIGGNLIWKYVNAPKISVGFHDYSDNSASKYTQDMQIKVLDNKDNKDNKDVNAVSILPDYLKYAPPTADILQYFPKNENGIQEGLPISNKNIQIFTLEITNKGMSAARNALLYFDINGRSRICKWNSVPAPVYYYYLYNIYQKLTLLQDLPEEVAFAFRFQEDPPHLLRQYDLISIYTILVEKNSNQIDCKNTKNGELIFYSEDYKGRCGISFSYDDKKKKIIITLYKLKSKKWDGFKSISIDKKNTLEIPYNNEK